MGIRRGVNQLTWDNFPAHKDHEGWHCRKCKAVLTGRKTAWCSKACLREVYLTVHWGTIRRAILRRDKYMCVLCRLRASQVDHIVEMADGGSFHEPSNLRSLCGACHKAKTAAMRKVRAAKKKAQKQEENGVLSNEGPEGQKDNHGK